MQTIHQYNGELPLLSTANLAKTYVSSTGEKVEAVRPVNITLGSNEFVSLVGPSGCGKTTLLKMCAGLIPPTEGEVRHRDGTGVPLAEEFGMVFQSPALLPWRTVLNNVLLVADILDLDRPESRDRALELLQMVDLGEAVSMYPTQLSGGMQQRVALVRALLHDPDILFMDEPFGALDAMTREELNAELQRIFIAQKKSVLFVTHSIEESVFLSDRVLVMSSGPGRLVADVRVEVERPRDANSRVSDNFKRAENEIRTLLFEAVQKQGKEEGDAQ